MPDSIELTARQKLTTAITALGLTVEATFVPWGKSRSAPSGHRSLNWKISLVKAGWMAPVLVTDYTAGLAHCPSYRPGARDTLDYIDALRMETEEGRAYRRGIGWTPILPDPADVVYSLIHEADVLDHQNFESWASNLGYDTDSRSAERIYRECLGLALQLRNAIGEDGLATLRDASQDF